MILSNPKPDFFNPEVDKATIDKFIHTHSYEENKIFLSNRKTDYSVLRPEIEDLLLINNYKLNGEPVSEERRLILTGLTKYYDPSEKKKIRVFFINLLKRHDTLILQTINIYLPLYEQDAENSQSSSSVQEINEITLINYLGPGSEAWELFLGLAEAGFIKKFKLKTFNTRVHCNDNNYDIPENFDTVEKFVWLKDRKALRYFIEGLIERKKLDTWKKWTCFEKNLVDKENNPVKNLAGVDKGSFDYDSEEFLKIDAVYKKVLGKL